MAGRQAAKVVAQLALADVARCLAAFQVRYHLASRATPLTRGPLAAGADILIAVEFECFGFSRQVTLPQDGW